MKVRIDRDEEWPVYTVTDGKGEEFDVPDKILLEIKSATVAYRRWQRYLERLYESDSRQERTTELRAKRAAQRTHRKLKQRLMELEVK